METKPFRAANLVIESKGTGSLGGVLFSLGTYFCKSYVMYQKMKETSSNYDHPGVSSEPINAKTSDNVSLCGHLFWPESIQDRKSLPTVIFFHGNKGTIGQKLDYIGSYVKACNCNLIVFGYRGYSKSAGHPSADGLMKDTDAILSKVFTLDDKIDLDKVIVHGRSLGGGAGSYIVSKEPWKSKVRAVILDTTFNSVTSMVTFHMSTLSPVVNHIFANEQWEVVEAAKKFREDMPVLIIGVVDDGICPYEHSVTLHQSLDRLNRPVSLVTFPDGGHIEFCSKHSEKYFDDLKAFVNIF